MSMLGAIKGEELSDVVCVVVRYFGKSSNVSLSTGGFREQEVKIFAQCSCHGATVIVIGGIKLGAGGLIRAYGASARQVLREAPVDILIPKQTFRVCVKPDNVGVIYDGVAKAGGATSGEQYGADGSLSVTITCDLAVADQLRASLTDATRGTIQFLVEDGG